MVLRQSGLDLVMKGANAFIANLGKIQTGYQKAGEAAAKATSAVEKATTAAENAIRRQANAQSNLSSAINRTVSTEQDIANATLRLTKLMDDENASVADQIMAQNRLTQAYLSNATAMNNAENAVRNLEIATTAVQAAEDKLISSQNAEIDATNNQVEGILQMVMAYTNVGQRAQQFITIVKAVANALGPAGLAAAALVTTLGGLAIAATKVVGVLFNLAKTAAGVVVSALKGIANAAKSVLEFFTRLAGGILREIGDSLRRVFEIFLGLSLYNAVQNIAEAIRNLADEVFEAAVQFQALELRLNSLMARDYTQAFGGSMEDAIIATTGATQNLFDWMRRLAVQSPFDFEDIAKVYTMAEAMGITGETAKRLTSAIINFTSAMGLTGETMWRIIYNFGQMIQRGKLSGEEFRDLARNFVPIDIIMTNLAERANMTKEAFRDLALKGGVPVNAFLEEFMQLTERDWSQAAIRMSKTFQAVLDNIKEFVKLFIGMDVIKPVLDRISGLMADFLDRLTENVTMMNSFKLIGQALLAGFNAMLAPVDALMKALGSLAGAIGFTNDEITLMTDSMSDASSEGVKIYSWAKQVAITILTVGNLIGKAMTFAADKIAEFASRGGLQFGGFIAKVKKWGYDLIVTFVNGIATGLGLLTKVIGKIGEILAMWLKGSSPPLIAPDVDLWGANLMNEYIKGFTMADFDMFNDVAGLIEDFFRSIENKIGEENLIPTILGSRADIAQAIAAVRNGTMSVTQAINKMISSLGEARPEFASYIGALFGVAEAERKLAIASDAVKAAQAAVNAVSSKYEVILAGLRKQLTQVTTWYSEEVRLREINEAMATQLLTDDERERLEMEKKSIEIERQIRAIEEQRDAELAIAEAQLAAAQAAQEAAQAELALAQARADILREQIEAMIENNELVQAQIELLKKLAETLEDTGEDNPIEDLIDSAEDATDLFGDLSYLFDEAAANADKIWKNLEGLFTGISSGGLGSALDNLRLKWEGLGNLWSELSSPGGALSKLWEKLQEVWLKIREFLGIPEDQSFLDWAIDKLWKLGAAIVQIGMWAITFGKGLLSWFNDLAIVPGVSIAESIKKIVDALDRLFSSSNADKDGNSPTNAFLYKLAGALKFISDIVVNIVNPLNWLAAWMNVFAESVEGLANVKEITVKFFDSLKGMLDSISELTAAEKFFAITDWLLEELPKAIGSAAQEWVQFVKDIISEAKKLFLGIADENQNESVANGLKLLNDKTQETLQGESGILKIWTDTTSGITGSSKTMSEKVISDFDGVSTSMTTMVEDFSTVSVPAFVEHTDEMKTAADLLQQSIQKLADSVWDLVNGVNAASTAGLDLNAVDLPGFAAGGRFSAGQPFIAGEKGPELIYPKVPGIVVPDLPKFYENMMSSANPIVNAQPVVQNVDRSTHVTVNANYANQQSEADIYYDVTAALAAIGR